MPETRMQLLSPGRRLLLEFIRTIRFGQILDLKIRGGQPTLDPPPRVIRTIRFGSDSDPRSEVDLPDFELKKQVVEMFLEFDRLRNGTIASLEVQHGLPFRMVLEEAAGQSAAEVRGWQEGSR